MVLFPKMGGRYWIITDFWERFYPIPVTIVAMYEEQGAFIGRWDVNMEHVEAERFEDLLRNEFYAAAAERFEGLLRNELYATEAEARAAIREKETAAHEGVEEAVNYLEE